MRRLTRRPQMGWCLFEMTKKDMVVHGHTANLWPWSKLVLWVSRNTDEHTVALVVPSERLDEVMEQESWAAVARMLR